MTQHSIPIHAGQGVFEGLAKQNMEFHQCIAELVDNAIAANEPGRNFNIEIFLMGGRDDDKIDVYIVDDCGGMNWEIFQAALQLGESATTDDRLNEHGFGLKNSLATLSGNNGFWKLWTSPQGQNIVYSTEGPFGQEMQVEDDDEFPELGFLPADISTLVHVPVRLSFLQTVQGRGAPAKDLTTLRSWLVEHLGVFYRGYLGVEPGDVDGSIHVSVGSDRQRVPPIPVPMGNTEVEYFDIELGGEVYPIEYEFGTLDQTRRDRLLDGEPAKYYYQGNQQTQGIDIRLGNRTIATAELSNIWRTKEGEEKLSRHNRFNDFVGELKIPGDVERGVLTTTNDKTDFNLDDPGWQKIFDELNDHRPIEDIRERTQSSLRDEWISRIESTNPDDTVTDERHVWPPGARIDVYRETNDGRLIIYEMKTGSGSPQHLYQLKMYWDGLCLDGDHPEQAVLLVEDFNSALEEMANLMNEELTPPEGSNPYNIKIEKHEDKGLD